MGSRTKQNSILYTEGANIDANYGPWNSISEYTNWIINECGMAVKDGVTIAVKAADGTITKYLRQNNSWVAEGGGAAPSVKKTCTVFPSGEGDEGARTFTLTKDTYMAFACDKYASYMTLYKDNQAIKSFTAEETNKIYSMGKLGAGSYRLEHQPTGSAGSCTLTIYQVEYKLAIDDIEGLSDILEQITSQSTTVVINLMATAETIYRRILTYFDNKHSFRGMDGDSNEYALDVHMIDNGYQISYDTASRRNVMKVTYVDNTYSKDETYTSYIQA